MKANNRNKVDKERKTKGALERQRLEKPKELLHRGTKKGVVVQSTFGPVSAQHKLINT